LITRGKQKKKNEVKNIRTPKMRKPTNQAPTQLLSLGLTFIAALKNKILN
jgi:hypothetical protein